MNSQWGKHIIVHPEETSEGEQRENVYSLSNISLSEFIFSLQVKDVCAWQDHLFIEPIQRGTLLILHMKFSLLLNLQNSVLKSSVKEEGFKRLINPDSVIRHGCLPSTIDLMLHKHKICRKVRTGGFFSLRSVQASFKNGHRLVILRKKSQY